jgi:hypothetical protein
MKALSMQYRFMKLSWGLALAILLTGCVTQFDGPDYTEAQVHRQVIDKDTGNAIPGVIVAFKWTENRGFSPGGSHTACAHVAMLHADDQGRYIISKWHGEYPGTFRPYKAGYSEFYDPVARKQGIDYMKRSTGSTQERYDELDNTLGTLSCNSSEDKNLLELYRATYEEARSIVRTEKDALRADSFLIPVDAAMFGSDEASKRVTERAIKRTKEQQIK